MTLLATIGLVQGINNVRHDIKVRLIPSRNHAKPSTAPIACFFHGMADTGATWDDVTEALPGHDLWIFDMPWSGVAGSNWSTEKSPADWIEEAMSLLPKEPSLCIGHSFGCTALLDWALDSSKASADTNYIFMAPVYLASQSFPDTKQIAEFRRNVPDRLVNSLRSRLSGRVVKDSILEKVGAKLAERILPHALNEMFVTLKRISENSLVDLMHKLTIIYGSDDDSMVCSGTKALGLATASLVYELEDCGHNPAVERSVTVKKILSSFDVNLVDNLKFMDLAKFRPAPRSTKPIRAKAAA